MTTQGRILIVDDDPDFLAAYRSLLSGWGYEVGEAKTADDAIVRFGEPGWSVILLDQKLRGPGGSNEGIDLVPIALRSAPEAKVLVVTAYADRASIERAFSYGVYDYLQKDQHFEPFLKAKLRNATEVWRERQLAALSVEKREKDLQETWSKAIAEKNSQKKGELLERVMQLLFRSIPGFEHAKVNRQNELEEIDVLVQNSSDDSFWKKEGNYVLIECKHWSKPVGVPELKLFRDKVEDRYGRSTLGFFIAMAGYSETTKIEEWTRRSGKSLVVLLNRDDLDALVKATDRSAKLKELHMRAVTAGHD